MNFIEEYRPLNGYISNVPPDGGGLKNYMGPGSQNIIVLGPGLVESFKGFVDAGTISRSTLNWTFGDTVLGLGEHPSTDIGSGNALLSVGKTIFLIGTGKLRVDGNTITGVSATSNLQLVLYNAGYSSSNLYQAGLAAPSAPTLTATGSGGKNTGTFTLVYTKVRTNTGAESKPSPPSNVATATQQQLQATFPLFSSWTDGTNAYNLYYTPANFGVKGPWLFLKQITSANLDGSGNHTAEFTDAELTPDEPPIDFGVPPAGTHAWQMGNVMIVGGTFGGFGISSSVPNYFEAYPATSTYFLPEALLGTAGGPQDGFTLLLCKGSTHAAVWTGAPDGPTIIARPLWNNLGFPSANSVTIAGKQVYGYTEEKGMVRTGLNGEPDFEFGRRVAPDTVGWTAANVVVGYSPTENKVYYAHQSTILAYNIDLDVWDTPVSESNPVNDIYTKNNKAVFVTVSGSTYKDRKVNPATGTLLVSTIVTPWMDGGVGPLYKNLERVLVEYQSLAVIPNASLDYYKNGSSTSLGNFPVSANGLTTPQHSAWMKHNFRNLKSFQIKFTATNPINVVRLFKITMTGSYEEILQG